MNANGAGDGAFEYDVILKKEPPSNVVEILIDGYEEFDFFRQPDWVPDDFLKGSYAVYRRETFVGQGTGKLCHIHRPKIIDASGRWVWGGLNIAGNRLFITIPGGWLGGARYPVVVDPVVGTSTIGAQQKYRWYAGEDATDLVFSEQMPVNRVLSANAIAAGTVCTAKFYSYAGGYYDQSGFPVLYTDSNTKPNSRRSDGEEWAELYVTAGNPAGWRSAAFSAAAAVAGGSYLWFGIFTEGIFMPRFDYGGQLYYAPYAGDIPAVYPLSSSDELRDLKLSMYFEYTAAQNHARTITQGVRLSASVKKSQGFTRTCAAFVTDIGTGIVKKGMFQRLVSNFINGADRQEKAGAFVRRLREEAAAAGGGGTRLGYARGLFENARARTDAERYGGFQRAVGDETAARDFILRRATLFIKLLTSFFARDYPLARFLRAREELAVKSAVSREIVVESRIR